MSLALFLVPAWLLACALTSMLLLGRKKRVGWLVTLGQNLTWLAWGPVTGQWPLTLAGVIFGTIAIRNYRRWAPEPVEVTG